MDALGFGVEAVTFLRSPSKLRLETKMSLGMRQWYHTWRGRKDSDLRNVLAHVSPDYKSGALNHSATAPLLPFGPKYITCLLYTNRVCCNLTVAHFCDTNDLDGLPVSERLGRCIQRSGPSHERDT